MAGPCCSGVRGAPSPMSPGVRTKYAAALTGAHCGAAVGRDPWFTRITRAEVRSAQALDFVLTQFYQVMDAHHRKHLRPASHSRWGNPWWTPQLALERKRVNAARRRFQRCKDDALRAIFRSQYSGLLAAFRRTTAQAREAYMRGFCDECSRKSVFSAPYNQAFGKVRVDQVLPPLVRPDGSRTTTHLESAALLLQTQVAVDDPATDGPDRSYVSAPYVTRDQGVPLTYAELNAVVHQMRDKSAPGPDGLHKAQTPQERPVCRLSVQQARAMARDRGLHVYTDGSHTSLSSGAAYVVFGRGTTIKAVGRYQVQGATSAYCTEIVAFTEALIYLRSSASRQPTFLYTDCLSVLQALASPHCLDPRVDRIRALMAQISASRHPQAFHVPGHRGLFGNEIADYLAARAWAMITDWERDWSEHHTSTELHKWTPDVTNLAACYPPNRLLITLITAHGRFPCYFSRFGLIDEPTCPCGGDCPSIDHYFTVCPLTAHHVSQLRYKEDLATDHRRRLPADERNRALLTRVVAVISENIPDISR
ncbi:hypothetical protein HPB52_022910 [Rhipicephalus sanguineus]|uniref:RNase H type-1 domain-containing protein n=1 Tax=Rhipicephalus sanguineus TaxID=34632 RepID=A0A9D4Q3E6_RHISA|nr:hypothetical protein HPB52_022910 [Rhipicephalus sanguineus]